MSTLGVVGGGRVHLAELPHDLGALTRLEQLHASGCDLLALPASLGGLEALHTLHAARNRLSDLPPSLSRLTRYAHPGRTSSPCATKARGRVRTESALCWSAA